MGMNLWFQIEGIAPDGVKRSVVRRIKSIDSFSITPTKKELLKQLKKEGWKELCPLRFMYAL